jgi:hypothetical protein
VPPTATSAASGNTSPAGGDPAIADAIQAGLTKIEEAGSYRVALTMTASGNLGEGVPGVQPGQPVELIAAEGEVEGEDSRLVIRGLLSAFMGADPQEGLEVLTVGGTSYLRGPAPLLGANEARWYELPSDGSSPASSIQSGQIVGGLTEQDLDLSGFTAAGTEQLDGQQCQVYVGDKEATIRAFEQVDSQGIPGPQSLSEVDQAEMKFYICADGYLHQMTLDFEGTAEGQSEPAAFVLNLKLSDFDADIRITPPDSPAKLEAPAFPMTTPTP